MEGGESFEIQKRKRGRPSIPIEIKKQNKTKWMMNSEWYCDICNNGINYKYTGKCNHLKTQSHQRRVEKINLQNKIKLKELIKESLRNF